MLSIDCPAFLPAWLCAQRGLLVYLLPSLCAAIIFRILARRHPLFFSLYLSGTFLHELSHFMIGLLTHARPVAFSVMPRRSGNQWILGSVRFTNVRWYNAVFVGLAPLLILVVPVLTALMRVRFGEPFNWWDAGIALLLAPVYLSFLPSPADLLIALRSWPYAVLMGPLIWLRYSGAA